MEENAVSPPERLGEDWQTGISKALPSGALLYGVENSPRLLGADYLDLVLLHWPFADYYTAWRELENLRGEGKVRAIGVSNFEPDRLIDLIACNRVKPAVNQIETHLYFQRQTEHVWEKKYGVAHRREYSCI